MLVEHPQNGSTYRQEHPPPAASAGATTASNYTAALFKVCKDT